MKKRDKLERRDGEKDGEDTYWLVDPETGVGRKITWAEYYREEAARGRRDIFAVGAMIGLLSSEGEPGDAHYRHLATKAYRMADGMLAERELVREGD